MFSIPTHYFRRMYYYQFKNGYSCRFPRCSCNFSLFHLSLSHHFSPSSLSILHNIYPCFFGNIFCYLGPEGGPVPGHGGRNGQAQVQQERCRFPGKEFSTSRQTFDKNCSNFFSLIFLSFVAVCSFGPELTSTKIWI